MISSVVDSLRNPRAIKISSVVDWRRIWLAVKWKNFDKQGNLLSKVLNLLGGQDEGGGGQKCLFLSTL